MKRSAVVCAVLAVCGMGLASTAFAETTGNATVTLAASANSMIQIIDATMTLTPTANDYDNDFVDAAGASGLRVRVKTNSSTGMVLKVKCADASPQIALADLLLKTATPAGTGGSTIASFTPATAADQNLWSTTTVQHAWQTVVTDLRVQNLFNYDDAASAGTTSYTNTLTYTVVTQ